MPRLTKPSSAGANAIASNEILTRETDRALRLCRARYRLSEEDARDVAQEFALKLWKSLPLMRNAAAVPKWTQTVIRNACLKHLTSRIASLEIDDADQHEILFDQDEVLERELRLTDVERYLERMSEHLPTRLAREHYLQGQAVRDIAATHGLPVNTVLSHLHRFRQGARECLGRHGAS